MRRVPSTNTDQAFTDSTSLGGYGFRLAGLESAADWLTPSDPQWPVMSIVRRHGHVTIHPYLVNDERAEFCTRDQTDQIGSVHLDRLTMTARFTSPGGFSDNAVVHPDLGLLGAIAQRWGGRDVFHGGAFLTDRGAWAVLGAKEAGKSSLLGLLAAGGVGIVADDALVVADQQVLAGPRCIDLRESAADWLQQGSDIGMIGERRRWRVRLPAVPSSAPLRGWVLPTWGAELSFHSVPPRDRLQLLCQSLTLADVPIQPAQLLALAALPMIVFRRPRLWPAAEESTDRLLEHLQR